MSKLTFSQFVLREKSKTKWDFLFGNNYDNYKEHYDWMLRMLKKSTLSKLKNKYPDTVEEWNEWVDKKLGQI